jgi:hypothetical protein
LQCMTITRVFMVCTPTVSWGESALAGTCALDANWWKPEVFLQATTKVCMSGEKAIESQDVRHDCLPKPNTEFHSGRVCLTRDEALSKK